MDRSDGRSRESRSRELLNKASSRRSCRRYSREPVDIEIIRNCVKIAGTAPSGANQQPWTYVIVSDAETQSRIRAAAEAVEAEFYRRSVTEAWKAELEPLGVNWRKPFLEEAPYLVCVFVLRYGIDDEGNRAKHYYPTESACLSVGFFISAVHQVGLATLPYTPAPMGFLREILKRPENERPLFILPVGLPRPGHEPPEVSRKNAGEFIFEVSENW